MSLSRMQINTSKYPGVKRDSTKKKNSKSINAPDLLSNARMALEIAAKLVSLTPLPFLGPVFESALIIINAASQVRDNKLQCAELAQYAAQLTHEVAREIHGLEELNDSLNTAGMQLLIRLHEIRDFMGTQANLGVLKRIVNRNIVTEKLVSLKTNLDNAMTMFTFSCGMCTLKTIQGVKNTQDNERKYDEKNRYRIYREGEVDRLARHEQLEVRKSNAAHSRASAEFYDAEVEGKCRVLKWYHDSNTFQRDLTLFDILRKCPSVNLAQIQGHSPMTSDSHFIVLKGDLQPFNSYVMSLDDVTRYLVALRATVSIMDTTTFLRSHNLTWTNETSKLMLNSRQEVVLGTYDDIRPSQRPSEPARIPILTDWGSRNNGTISYRRSKPLSLDKLQSEQPSINTLQLALTHPYPRQWSVNDIARLWHQYAAEWGSVLLSSTQTVRIAKMKPLIGFGHLWEDAEGHRQLVNWSPSAVGDQYVRHDSFHKTSDGHAVPSRKSLFHGLSSFTNVCEVRATIRRDVPLTIAWDAMLCSGPATAAQHGVELKDLIFVYQVTQQPSAFLDSGDPSEIQFHLRPLGDDGFLQEPWGYFSTEHDILPDGETLPVEYLGIDKECGKSTFSNNPPGVEAVIQHFYKICYIQLHPRDATFVEWMHSHFS